MTPTTTGVKRKASETSKTTAVRGPLSAEELRKMDAYWRASNYLSVGQIYLLDNPLLRAPLAREHIKPRLLGHWGTTPGLNFIYVHLNRIIRKGILPRLPVAVIVEPSVVQRGPMNAQLL